MPQLSWPLNFQFSFPNERPGIFCCFFLDGRFKYSNQNVLLKIRSFIFYSFRVRVLHIETKRLKERYRKKVCIKESMSKHKRIPFLFILIISIPWISNELLWSLNKLKQILWLWCCKERHLIKHFNDKW